MRTSLAVVLLAWVSLAQVKEDLGVVIQTAHTSNSSVGHMGGDDIHYIGLYDTTSGYLGVQLFDVNLTTGASRVVSTGLGGQGTARVTSTQNTKFYTTVGDPCYFYEYDPALGTITRLTHPSWTSNTCGPHGYDKAVQIATEGAPGHLFFGTAVRGTVFQYDTNTGTLTDYGLISPPSIAISDMTMDAVDDKKFTSATHSFLATEVGAAVNVISGTGWTPGTYTVASVSSGAAILNSSPSAAGNGNLGTGKIVNTNCATPACYRYVYSIQADANYIYVGMKDSYLNANWLTIVNISDGTQTDCWKDTPFTVGGVGRRMSDGRIGYTYWDGVYKLRFLPTDGTCPVDESPLGDTFYPYYWQVGGSGTDHVILKKDGLGDGIPYAPTYLGVDLDVSYVDVDTSTSGTATLLYRNPSGSGSYIAKTETIAMLDARIQILGQQGTSDALMVVSGAYGPNSINKVSDRSAIAAGKAAQSTYGMAWDESSAAWYLSGYSASFLRYEPTAAWTVNPGNLATACGSASPTNPCSADTEMLKYSYYAMVGSDGLIYTVNKDERSGATGGGIRWYNPTTHAVASYRDGPPSLACFTPHGAAMLTAGSTIAYSGYGVTDAGLTVPCAESEGKIFLFDVATKTISRSFTPVALSNDAGTLTTLPNDHLMGVIRSYPATGSYTIYSVDPTTGVLDWSITGVGWVGASTVGSASPAVGPDGYIYLYIDYRLTRLHPLTGVIETAYTDSMAHGGMSLVTGPFGNAMYLWGSTHLYRINLWRPAALRVRNSHSTATQVRLKYGRTTTLDATAQTVACAYEAACYVAIPGHVIGDMYYQWEFLTAGDAVAAASDVTKVTIQ